MVSFIVESWGASRVKRAAVANGSPMRKEYPRTSSPAKIRTEAIKDASILAGLLLVRYLFIALLSSLLEVLLSFLST
jgi:hypothetical protein